MRGHLPGSVGQIYADDGRKELGCQANGKGQRKEKRVNNGTSQVDIDGENCHHQDHSYL